jgi:LmbE family N-acetylglucosaminyl deacetylase
MTTGTLLGVWAHPDDETYLSAGLMAEARQRGDRVVVVTATAGEHGTDDPVRWPPKELATHRRQELQSALDAIGVEEHHVLGYPDGDCASQDGIVRIATIMYKVRPDTIVTFGPDGMTGHPDHRAVSKWTTAAWLIAGRDARLWYATLTPAFHERWGELNDRFGMWEGVADPPCTQPADLAHHGTLDGLMLDRKLTALRAHASQTRALIDAVGEPTFRTWWSSEAFVDASRIFARPCLLAGTC